MNEMIDCLLIGHNQPSFEETEKLIRGAGGTKSPAYRDLNLSFITADNRIHTLQDIYNRFAPDAQKEPLSHGNFFNAAIAYLGTYLSRRGFSFNYIHSFQDEKNELIDILKKGMLRSIAITTTYYTSVFPIIEIITLIKRYNDTVPIIIGGPFIVGQMRMLQEQKVWQDFLATLKADFYINSAQGETALVKVLQAIKDGGSFDHIPNLTYRRNAQYFRNDISIETNRLEENMVDWDLFADRLGKLVTLRTAISCPYACAFCGFPEFAGEYQTITMERVEAELDKLDRIGKVAKVNFVDDTFNIPPQRFKEILKLMIRKKYHFKWNSFFRCQFADPEMVELMKESGCEGVFLGIESGSQRILNNMNKHSTIDAYKYGLDLLKKYELITYASFIIGFPGETLETVRDTIQFIEENQPTFYRLQIWYCNPHAPIMRHKSMYNIQGSEFEWSHQTMDVKTAVDIIEAEFIKLKSSIWVPQSDFDYMGIYNLLDRGLNLEQIKDFISIFMMGVKEKLITPQQPEVNLLIWQRLQEICQKKPGIAFDLDAKPQLNLDNIDFEL